MRVTEPSAFVVRRVVFYALTLVLFFAFSAQADERSDALDAIAPLAAALSSSDSDMFLRSVPSNTPNAAELRENITALLAQCEVSSSVEVITAEADSASLDWYMEIRSKETRSVLERRRGTAKIRFRKRELSAIEPASLFAPPRAEGAR